MSTAWCCGPRDGVKLLRGRCYLMLEMTGWERRFVSAKCPILRDGDAQDAATCQVYSDIEYVDASNSCRYVGEGGNDRTWQDGGHSEDGTSCTPAPSCFCLSSVCMARWLGGMEGKPHHRRGVRGMIPPPSPRSGLAKSYGMASSTNEVSFYLRIHAVDDVAQQMCRLMWTDTAQ